MGNEAEEQWSYDSGDRDMMQQALNEATVPLQGYNRSEPDWYLDLEKDLENFKHYIRAEMFDAEKGEYIRIGKPLMNLEGTGFIIGYIQSCVLSKNLLMSNIPNMNIANGICKDVCLDIVIYLMDNQRQFEIELKNMRYLNSAIRQMIRASVLRAFAEGERNRLKLTYRRTEQTGQQQKRGWLPGFLTGGD